MCRHFLRYLNRVKITNHACKRFWEYTKDIDGVGNKNWNIRRIKKLVAKKLTKEIRKGLFIDKTGAAHIPIDFGLYAAIIFPSDGYLVVTFHKNERNLDINKFRKNYENNKTPQ